MKFRAVIFDLDGTLRDTQEIIFEAYEHAVEVHNGRKPTREELEPHIHHHSIVHRELSSHVDYDAWLATYRGKLGNGWMDAPFFPDTEHVLGQFKTAGLQLAVVTAADHNRTLEYLRYRGIDQFFDVVVGMSTKMRPKPAPDMINEAVRQLGCRPKQAIMIGDMATDVEAAHAAGIICVGTTHGFATREQLQLAGADYIVNSLAELPDIVLQKPTKG